MVAISCARAYLADSTTADHEESNLRLVMPDAPPPHFAGGSAWPFVDVEPGAWYYNAARYVYDRGLMKGASATCFAPATSLSRALLVMALYRLEGEPAVTGSDTFIDVAVDAPYYAPVTWAVNNGIITGYDERTFGPRNSVTRQQLAVILHRYARLKGYDVRGDGEVDLRSFADASSVSPYASTAIRWAFGTGIMRGNAGKLNPLAHATRAQAAAMLLRLTEKVAA